jgi:hypothetical protein
MSKIKASILDAILLKFQGDISIQHYMQINNQFKDIDNNYFVIENHLKFLEAENMLNCSSEGIRKLSPRGWATMTDIKNLGYEKKAKKEKRVSIINTLTFIFSFVSVIILCQSFYRDVFLQANKENHSPAVKSTIQHEQKLMPKELPSKNDSDLEKTNNDTSFLQPKKQK